MISFSERLTDLLSGRGKNAWGKVMGFNSSNITRMFRNEIPGYEILSAIMKMENVSLSWLLEGKGSPFLIDVQETAEGLAEMVEEHLKDGGWTDIYVTNAPNGVLVTLSQPGQYDYKGTAIDYRIIEVVTGPLSEALVQLLEKAKAKVWLGTLEPADAQRIVNGEAGTFLLFGDDKHEGLLSHPDGLMGQTMQDIWSLSPSKPQPAAGSADTHLMRGVIEHIDNMLIEEGIELDTAARARLITAAYRNAEKKGAVDPDLIAALIEAASD